MDYKERYKNPCGLRQVASIAFHFDFSLVDIQAEYAYPVGFIAQREPGYQFTNGHRAVF